MTESVPSSEPPLPHDAGEADGAGAGTGNIPASASARPARIFTKRAVVALAAAGAVVIGGYSLNHGKKAEVALVAPPEPVSSEAPVVDDEITRLDSQLKENPDDAEAWQKLGWSHFQTGDYAGAAAALRKATKLDPTHAETFSFLGESLVLASKREGRMPREARRAFEKAIKLNPKDARARYFRALAYDLGGQHRRAIKLWFDQLKETPPDAPYADDLRKVIRSVGEKHKIEVEKRLAEVQFVPPPPAASTSKAPDAAKSVDGGKSAEGAKDHPAASGAKGLSKAMPSHGK